MRTLWLFVFITFVAGSQASANQCRDIFTLATNRGSAKSIMDEQIFEMIRYLQSQNLPVHSHAMRIDTDGKIHAALKEKFGYTAQPSSLLRTGMNRFGSWNAVLERAKVESTSSVRPDWTEAMTVEILQRMRDLGVDIRSYVHVVRDPRFADLLVEVRQGAFQPESFYAHIYLLYGGWRQMLEKLKFEGVSLVNTQSHEFHKQALTEMKTMGVLIESPRAIWRDPRAAEYLKEKVGPYFKPYTFYSNAKGDHKHWRDALVEYGLAKPKREMNEELLVEILRDLEKTGTPLNYAAVYFDRYQEVRQYLLEAQGLDFQAHYLITKAKVFFGSWDKALIAANLNPDVIRLKGTTPFHLLREWMKDERRRLSPDQWLAQRYVNKVSKNGDLEKEVVDSFDLEADIIRRQQETVVHKSIESLKVDEKTLFKMLVDEIEANGLPKTHDKTLPQAFAEVLNQRLENGADPKVLETQITGLMEKLLSDPELREALFE